MDGQEPEQLEPEMVPCDWCAAWLVASVDRCPVCGGARSRRRTAATAETIGWLAIGIPFALIAFAFALAFVAERLSGVGQEDLGMVAMLVGMAGFALMVPGIIVGLVLGLASRGGTGEAIVASWDVLASDGSVHAITLPAFRVRPPDHAWVDGGRIPLSWLEEDFGRSIARITTRDIDGVLRLWADGTTTALGLGVAILGGGETGPWLRASLEIEDALVRVVDVANGRRTPDASTTPRLPSAPGAPLGR